MRCQFTVGCVTVGLNSIAAAMQMNRELSLDKRWSPKLKKAADSFLKEPVAADIRLSKAGRLHV